MIKETKLPCKALTLCALPENIFTPDHLERLQCPDKGSSQIQKIQTIKQSTYFDIWAKMPV